MNFNYNRWKTRKEKKTEKFEKFAGSLRQHSVTFLLELHISITIPAFIL